MVLTKVTRDNRTSTSHKAKGRLTHTRTYLESGLVDTFMNEKSGNYWYTDEWKSRKYWYTDSLKIREYWYNHDEWKIREVVSTETLINEKSGKYWYIDSLKIREVLIYSWIKSQDKMTHSRMKCKKVLVHSWTFKESITVHTMDCFDMYSKDMNV